MRYCRGCKTVKALECFWKNKAVKDGYDRYCRDCSRIINRKYHAKAMRNYRKSFRGLLDQKYTSMRKRVMGKDPNCINTVKGLPIVSRKEFVAWATEDNGYKKLWGAWKASGYQRGLTPSIDRIDSTKGYVFGNMQFLPFYENCRKWRTVAEAA